MLSPPLEALAGAVKTVASRRFWRVSSLTDCEGLKPMCGILGVVADSRR